MFKLKKNLIKYEFCDSFNINECKKEKKKRYSENKIYLTNEKRKYLRK